ncbi:hypothetical protein JCM19992_05550 [Thermostilla marina]
MPRMFCRALMLAVVAAAAVIATARFGAADTRPNIVLVITDQQSADLMSCRIGDRWLRTPAMDSLASQGVLFTRAYSSNPLCMPLRNSLFTGRYPHETRVMHNATPKGGLDFNEFVMMGRYFREAGYETAYCGKWHLCFPIKDESTHGFKILKHEPIPKEEGGVDATTAAAAVDFLEREHKRPFLLVVSFLNPHNVCEWARFLAGREQNFNCGEVGTPPPLDECPPPPENWDPPVDEPDGMTLIRKGYHADPKFPVGDFTRDDWRRHRWGYYRMIEKVDAELGKVLDALKRRKLDGDTVVVFTSDHGDCAGAHHFNQKTVLYEESVRIPLIISWPGHTPKTTTDLLVNTGVDTLPTLLELAGIPIPSKLPGRSLAPVVLGKKIDVWREYVVSEDDMVQTGPVNGYAPKMQGRMVRSDRFKYCLYQYGNRRESLYDLENDPGETVNLAYRPEYREVVRRHREMLREFAVRHHDTLALEMLADDVAPRPFPKD